MERADLETMARTLGLDGQILPLGPATVAYWKMPDGRAPVLIKALVSSRVATLNVQKFETAPKGATHRE